MLRRVNNSSTALRRKSAKADTGINHRITSYNVCYTKLLRIQFIKENYGTFFIDCKTYDRLYEYMLHDKKNSSGIINFTLLKEVGDVSINQSATKDEIFET